MNNLWAFAPMVSSNELLDRPDALAERMDEHGYLLFRKLLDPDAIAAVRRDVMGVLARRGWILGGDSEYAAGAMTVPVREGEDEYFAAYDEVQKLESFHTLAHDEALLRVMRLVVGETAFPHPLKVARLVFPSAPEVSTPPHQDFLNNQGSPKLTAAWIPLDDCPMQKGTIAVLRGSHRYGVLPLAWHLGPGNRQAVLPAEMQEELRWVTTDMEIGDVLVFGALTVHAALNNGTTEMRLSADFRFQPEGAPLSDRVLKPHFERLTWEEIYAGWSSDRFKYYWRDLDFEVVPYDETPLHSSEPTDEDLSQALLFERIREQRFAEQRDRS